MDRNESSNKTDKTITIKSLIIPKNANYKNQELGGEYLKTANNPFQKMKIYDDLIKRKIKFIQKTEEKDQDNQITNRPIKPDDEIIYKHTPKPEIQKNKLLKFKSIVLFSLLLLLSLLIFVGLIIVFVIIIFKNKNKKNGQILEEEDLIIRINYIKNTLLKFKSEKIISISVENDDDYSYGNNKRNIIQYIDFFFIIREKNISIDEQKYTYKNVFIGYLGILNITINNNTDNITILYDKKLNEYINNKEVNLRVIEENNNLCFIKIEFYENGEIKNIYIPELFDTSNMIFVNNIIKLIIPKISPNLYTKNIINTIEGINNYDKQDSEYYENNNLRVLDNNDSQNKSDEIIIDKYLSDPVNDINKCDLREKFEPNNNVFLNDVELKDVINLTEYSIEEVENSQMQFKNSQLKTIIYSLFDNNGTLFFIEEIQNMNLNQIDNNDEFDNDEEKKLNSKIYNEDNIISKGDTIFEDENDYNNNSTENETENEILIEDTNNVSFNLSGVSFESINNISLYDSLNNDEVNKKLFDYFDSFNYEIYNQNTDKEIYLRFLKYKEKIIKNNNLNEDDIEYITKEELYNLRKNKLRNLNENNYYGVKKATYDEKIYRNNILGLGMGGETFSETDSKTGLMNNYFVMNFGLINTKFNLGKKQSNLNIIIDRTNQMTFKFISLLYQSNKDLIDRNKKYGDVIIKLEKNTSNLFEEIFDFSGIFRNTLNDMYIQVKNFSGLFFIELIELINKVHTNYTKILNDVKLNKFEEINQIRIVSKMEYINYINRMVDILADFENKTLIFLNDIENELKYIASFQIDVLYDIIDSIYDCKLIFKEFNRNLFKAIEKGIITFKYDIKDYIEEIIGDLLYITDFLSVNINKNEILINAYDEDTRKDISKKLREFRDIILTIMDFLINNLNSDYENEMSINNKDSIKYISENKALNFLNNIEEKSNEIINEIKLKISFMNLYEKYAENIDEINIINNKTINEFNNDIYEKILKQIIKIQPEYLDKNSKIIEEKNKLINITKNISYVINNEINEINSFINNFTKNYFQENLYNFHYNLYFVRKFFLNDEMEKLLNDFKILINNTIKVHYIQLIDYNYDLAYQVFNEEISLFYSYGSKKYMGSGFYERYYSYKTSFQEYIYTLSSEDFHDLIEKYFYKIRDYILDYIKEQILSINMYYFNNELYKSHFYFIEQINNEIYKIIDNINNYYSELILEQLKIKSTNLTLEILQDYNKKKERILDDKFNQINSMSRYPYGCGCDYVYQTKRKAKRFWQRITVRMNCPHINNINRILKDLSKTNIFLNKETDIIIQNFIQKFDNYLKNYVYFCQTLFNNLFIYYETKINEHDNIINVLNDYKKIFIGIVDNNTNDNVLIGKNNNENDLLSILNKNISYNFQKNIDEIKEKYFTLFYLQDYQNFLEYPIEIKYKINQFKNEIKNNNDIINDKIDLLYKNKILNIINSTNNFIENVNNLNLKYIITQIKTYNIIDNYTISKVQILQNNFNCFSEILKNKTNIFYSSLQSNNALGFNEIYNNNSQINSIFNDFSYFINDFEDIIEQNFTIIKCSDALLNDTDIEENSNAESNSTYKKECWKEKFKTELNYSKYNFNIVKLRTGIYYTKTLWEIIDKLFDNFDYNNLINIQKINIYDNEINTKNILDTNNKTIFKLDEINKFSKSLLIEPFEYFIEDFKNKYSFDNDFMPFYDDVQKILKYEKEEYFNNITYKNNNTLFRIDNFLYDFNNTLYKQLSLINNYDYYNFNLINFQSIYSNYSLLIRNCFTKYKNKINGLSNNYRFYDSLKNILNNLQLKKRIIYKNKANEFSKNYDFELLNYSFNLGEEIELYLKKEYDDYEFSFAYKYFELFYNNTENYINLTLQQITQMEKGIQDKLKYIYDNFILTFTMNISDFVNYNYIYELERNYSECLNYSYDRLNDIIKEDEINYKEYIDYLELIDFYKNYCNENNTNNKSLENNSLEINNNYNKSCINISKMEEVIYFNKTQHLLNCYDNNYYNYSVIIFEEFNESNKKLLDNIISNIIKEIEVNYIDEIFLENYLEKYYHLQDINISFDDLYLLYEDFEDMIFYINHLKNNEYKDTLYKSFIDSFNESYMNLIDDYILNEIIDNTTILINEKLDIYIEFLKTKINNEFEYYKIIFNNTDSLGNTTKLAFKNLYSNFQEKMNESISYLLENEIYFYINIFLRENKNKFRNNFIYYIISEINDYNISIFKMEKYIEEIIYDKSFNKTLDNISSIIIMDIIEKMKLKINEIYDIKIQLLFNNMREIKNEIEEILNNITTNELPDDMAKINQIIVDYNILVKSQNNRYIFSFGERPFNLLNLFINNTLEPPLLLIKEMYNSIEERLLEEIIKLVEKFPDFYSIIKDKLYIKSRLENATYFLNEINHTLNEYKNILDNEIRGYFNKLVHYSYINGYNIYDKPCDESFCLISQNEANEANEDFDFDYNDINNIGSDYNLTSFSELRKKINRNIDLEDKTKGYDSSMGSLTKDDLAYYIMIIQNTLLNLNQTYLSKEFKNINKTITRFITKINETYLNKLERSFSMTLLHFSTVLTENSYQQLKNNIYKQYYDIELYINLQSNITRVLMDNYINVLNYTSVLIQIMDSMIYIKSISYYDIIDNAIKNKFKQIGSTLRNLDKSESNKNSYFSNLYGTTRDEIEKAYNYYEKAVTNHEQKFMAQFNESYNRYYKDNFDYITFIDNQIDKANNLYDSVNNEINNKIEEFKNYLTNTSVVKTLNNIKMSIESKVKNLFSNFAGKNGNYTFLENLKTIFKKVYKTVCKTDLNFPNPPLELDYPFPFMPIPAFPFLQVRIIPYLYLVAHFGTNCKNPNNDIGIFVDMYIKAEISLSLEVGIYIPGCTSSAFELSVSIGIKGVLFSGKIGLQLNINLVKKIFEIDLYHELRAFEYGAYAIFRIKINLNFIKLDMRFSILEKYFPNKPKNKHKILQYKLK